LLLLYGAPKVYGIPLPDDLFDVAGFVASQHFRIASNAAPEARDHALTEAIVYAFRSGFTMALATYADDLKDAPRRNPRIMKAVRRLAEQEENGEMLAAEGRAAKAVNDRRRADLIRRLYKSVRPSFPDGRKGNGLAHRAVAERYETQTDESVSERTVRDTVNKAGLSAPRRRKRKDSETALPFCPVDFPPSQSAVRRGRRATEMNYRRRIYVAVRCR
jgi:hypothetical protein